MEDLVEIKKYEVLGGSDINSIAYQVVDIAIEKNCIIEFEFNNILLRAFYFSQPQEIIDNYFKEFNRKNKNE